MDIALGLHEITLFEVYVLRLRLIASLAVSIGLLSPMAYSAQEMQLAYSDSHSSPARPPPAKRRKTFGTDFAPACNSKSSIRP